MNWPLYTKATAAEADYAAALTRNFGNAADEVRYDRARNGSRSDLHLTYIAAFVAAADRGMRACQDASRELRRMMDAINAGRVARGVEPLAIEITVPGE
jgi:hypothetical protein